MSKKTILNKTIYIIVFLSLIFNAVNLFPQIKSLFAYFIISALIYLIVCATINTIYKIDIFKILENKENVIIAKPKVYNLLNFIEFFLLSHEKTDDFIVKTIDDKTEIIDLTIEEYKQKKIDKLEKNYNSVLYQIEKWKNEEIENIMNDK